MHYINLIKQITLQKLSILQINILFECFYKILNKLEFKHRDKT
jgi:hypothetical protein